MGKEERVEGEEQQNKRRMREEEKRERGRARAMPKKDKEFLRNKGKREKKAGPGKQELRDDENEGETKRIKEDTGITKIKGQNV